MNKKSIFITGDFCLAVAIQENSKCSAEASHGVYVTSFNHFEKSLYRTLPQIQQVSSPACFQKSLDDDDGWRFLVCLNVYSVIICIDVYSSIYVSTVFYLVCLNVYSVIICRMSIHLFMYQLFFIDKTDSSYIYVFSII